MKKYSVLLQYPDDSETRWEWVKAENPQDAVKAALQEIPKRLERSYFDPLLVIEGWHADIKDRGF